MQIYAGNVRDLKTNNYPGVSEWGQIYNLLALNVLLIDRSEKITLPFNFKLYDKFKMPEMDTSFDLTYEQCCDRRATEIYELSKELDKPIYIFYSGGMDSTLVLVSFLKVIPENDRDRLVLLMNTNSIKEYPHMYYTYIRGKIKTVSSNNFSKYFDKSCILVGGEFNDQLFGSDIVKLVYQKYGFATVKMRYSREIITKLFLDVGMDSESANIWYDLLDESCKNSPVALVTVFDFLWWLNFNFKWQAVFFRLVIRCDKQYQSSIDDDFLNTYYHHFYGEEYFQLWSMTNQDTKIQDKWDTYKFLPKQIIYEFTNDAEYRDNKTKLPSLGLLFTQKRTPHALTTDFEFIDEFTLSDTESLYVPQNDFIPLPLNKQ
jgi:hypothetical protein